MKDGRSVGDAVVDAIEALPASKTRDLRRWLRDWEAWEEWQDWVRRGWAVKKTGRKITLYAPASLVRPALTIGVVPGSSREGILNIGEFAPNMPKGNVVAAGANVGGIHAGNWVRRPTFTGGRASVMEYLVSRLEH